MTEYEQFAIDERTWRERRERECEETRMRLLELVPEKHRATVEDLLDSYVGGVHGAATHRAYERRWARLAKSERERASAVAERVGGAR